MVYVAGNLVEGGVHGVDGHFPRRPNQAPDSDPDSDIVRYRLRLENFQHIRHAYGEDAAQASLEGVNRVLAELLGEDGAVVPGRGGTIELRIWDVRSSLGAGELALVCRRWLNQICRILPLLAFETAAGPVHLWLSGCWELSEGTDGGGGTDIGFRGTPASGHPGWAEQYREDMAAIARLLPLVLPDQMNAVDAPELALCWQPVRDAREPEAILYHEALVRLIAANGDIETPASLFLALERLGFARLVDRHIVTRVIDELAASPDIVLSVNISAQSAWCDDWWREIQSRLQRSPDVARRLVIEITETAAMPDIAEAVRFAVGMRRLGCGIALDDFGTGHASIRQLIAFAPDFVKVDRFFVRRSAFSHRDREMLIHMIGLARSFGTTIIVEGVETPEQAGLILAAGGCWQQGYHWGPPSFSRPWRAARFDAGPETCRIAGARA